jgi:hypothetical protein
MLAAAFQFGDGQYTGPRPGKVEEEICLLDPSTTSGRQRDCEGALERTDSDPGAGRMGESAKSEGKVTRNAQVPFIYFIDSNPGLDTTQFCYCEPDTEEILGAHDDIAEGDSDARLCFNCGSPDHAVSGCPSPPNFDLISLSRQLFNFIQSQRGNNVNATARIHIVEAQKQQRLQWL